MACSFSRMLDSNRFYSARNNLACGLIWTLMCISLLIFNACSTDGYELITPHKKLVLNLKLNLSGQSTRSNESSETVNLTEGSEIENLIDEEDLWIGVFDSNNHKKIDAKYSLNQIDNTVSITIATGEYYSEEIQLVACANWSRYGISNNVLESVKTVSELNDITFSFNPENLISDVADNLIDYYPLPMYGSTICSVNLESNEISIDMIRALAKIEIVDNLQGDVKIESAELVRYSTEGYLVPQTSNSGDNLINLSTSAEKSASDVGNNLTFNKIADSSNLNMFYVYIPEMNLGDVDSDYRKIILTLTDNKKSEICLINYSDGLPSADPNEKWQSLNRNHIYRFNVKELTSTEPEIQIQPTIRICWYTTYVKGTSGYVGNENLGKFENNSIYLVESIDKNPINDMVDSKQLSSSDYGESLYYFCRYVEFDLKNEYLGIEYDFNKLMYVLTKERSSNYNSSFFEPSYRNLARDIVKFENKGSITYCWLNQLQFSYQSNPIITLFPENLKYRIYWMGDSSGLSKVSVSATPLDTSSTSTQDIGINNKNGYYYIEFVVNGNAQVVTYNIPGAYKNGIPSGFKGRFSVIDIFQETIDGDDYYVFYAN